MAVQDSGLLSAALSCHDFAHFMVGVKSCAPRSRSLALARLCYPSAKSWLICLQVRGTGAVCTLVCQSCHQHACSPQGAPEPWQAAGWA